VSLGQANGKSAGGVVVPYRATVEEFAKKISAGLSGNFLSSTVLLGTAIHQKV